jgi:hypothetical protein
MKYSLVTLSLLRCFLFALALPAMVGCQETLIFFEQTAFKLGISVNEEPPVPLEVTVGLKRRVVAISPPKKPLGQDASGSERAQSEAVSLLSRFDIIYHPDRSADASAAPGNPLASKLQIISAFASGKAALPIAGNAVATALVVAPEQLSFKLDEPAMSLRDFVCGADPTCENPDATKFDAIRGCWPTAGVPEETLMFDFLFQDAFAEQRRAVAECMGL